MSIDQVSTIKQTQPGLYQCISELKKLIIATGTVECQETSCGEDNRSKIKTLLDSPQMAMVNFIDIGLMKRVRMSG